MTMNLFSQSTLQTLKIAIANGHRDPAHLKRISAHYIEKIEQEEYSIESLLLINHLLTQHPENFNHLFLHKLKIIDFIYFTHRFKIKNLDKMLKVHPQHIKAYFEALIKKTHHFKNHNCAKTLNELLAAKDTLSADRILRIQRFCPKSPHYLQDMFEMLTDIQPNKTLMPV